MSHEHPTDLSPFFEEIEELRRHEMKRETESAHFLDPKFNPRELVGDDREIWEKIKNATVTREEAREYQKKLKDLRSRGVLSRSRSIFAEFIGTKAPAVVIGREIKKREGKK